MKRKVDFTPREGHQVNGVWRPKYGSYDAGESIPFVRVFDHAHAFVRMRFDGSLGALWALIVTRLHLPMRLAIVAGDLPHDPECTPTEAVTRQ